MPYISDTVGCNAILPLSMYGGQLVTTKSVTQGDTVSFNLHWESPDNVAKMVKPKL